MIALTFYESGGDVVMRKRRKPLSEAEMQTVFALLSEPARRGNEPARILTRQLANAMFDRARWMAAA